MKLKYNAPVTLTYAFICAVLLLLSQTLLPGLMQWFTVPGRGGMNYSSVGDWFRVISYVFGHANWTHLLGNFSFILILGPGLEREYGTKRFLLMIGVTALTTGLLNAFLFSTSLLGASGIAFMMILLASFTNVGKGEIPLTFVLIVLIYLGKEVYAAFFESNDVSEFAHIIGGIIGSLFGFLKPPAHQVARQQG